MKKKYKLTCQSRKSIWYQTIAIVEAKDEEEAEEIFSERDGYDPRVEIVEDEEEIESEYEGSEITDVEEYE